MELLQWNVEPTEFPQVPIPEDCPWGQKARAMGLAALYPHQVAVMDVCQRLFQENRSAFIFVPAPTGSGKTLAAYLPVLTCLTDDGPKSLGVYPTNALIDDQFSTLYRYADRLGWDRRKDIQILHAQALDRLAAQVVDPSRIDLIAHTLRSARVVLTNPDILFYLTFFLYPSVGGSLWDAVAYLASFDLWVLDEFHLYDALQQACLFWTIGVRRRIVRSRPTVALLLSATPRASGRLRRWAETLDLEWISLESSFRSMPPTPDGMTRVIQEPVELRVYPGDLEAWEDGAVFQESILPLWEQALQAQPRRRAVFLLESLADTLSFEELYRIRFPSRTVALRTGLVRRGSLEADADLIGNSAVDVGVDLTGDKKRDWLAAVARTAEQAIQRMGRIGRDGRRDPDPPNQVHLIVPGYVFRRLQYRRQQDVASTYTREQLFQMLRDAFVTPTDFEEAARDWAPVVIGAALHGYRDLIGPRDPERAGVWQEILESFRRWWGQDPQEALENFWRKYESPNPYQGLKQGLLSFRGRTPQVVLALRQRDGKWEPPAPYDLFWVLRKCSIEAVLGETEFLRWCQETYRWDDAEADLQRRALRRADPLAYVQAVLMAGPNRKVRLLIESHERSPKISLYRLRFHPCMYEEALRNGDGSLSQLLSRCEEQGVAYPGLLVSKSELARSDLPPLFESVACYVRGRLVRPGRDPYPYAGSMFIGRSAFLMAALLNRSGLSI